MVHILRRQLVAVVALALVAGLAGSAALAAPGHRNGRFQTVRGGFFGAPGGGFGAFGGPARFGFGPAGFGMGMMGGPGKGFGFVIGGPGMMGGPGGGAAVLNADVLSAAASFLGISDTALQADLKGGKTLAQEATAKGKTADDLITAIVNAQKTVYDGENAAGWITDTQETALLAQFKDDVTQLVNAGPPVPPQTKQGLLQSAASYIGISVSDLLTALQGGKSLGQVATDNGKTVDGLVAALTAPAKTKLDAAVAAGDITAAQEQTLLTNLTARVTDLVNNTPTKPVSANANIKRLEALFKR
jgi:hypothetical protein